MQSAISNIVNLVTQSNSQPTGTTADPVVTTVSQAASDPIPVTNDTKGE